MKKNRIERVNSLLREVIYEVIHREVKNPHITKFITVTRVETTNDLGHAKVFISVIAPEDEKKKILAALQTAAGFIAIHSHKKIDRLRYFPELTFRLDTGLEEQVRIQEIIHKIETERQSREPESE